MYLKIKNSRLLKGISVFSALNLMFQIFYPTAAYALTSGPSQPEIKSFEPITTNQMVNQFTGDFTYNIPLLTVPGPNGGYPINMAYHSGITMDQEASWVGLGWNINPGALMRNVRGLPDDFNGAKVKKEYFTEPIYNRSYSAAFGAEGYAYDFLAGQVGLQLNSNSRTGVGLKFSASINVPMIKSLGTPSAGIGLDYDTETGVGLNYSFSLNSPFLSISKSYNLTKHGLQSSTLSTSVGINNLEQVSSTVHKTNKEKTKIRRNSTGLNFKVGGSNTFHYGRSSFTPQATFPSKFHSATYFGGAGLLGLPGVFTDAQLKYTDTKTSLKATEKLFDSYGYMYSENSTDDSMMDFAREKDGVLPYTVKNLPLPVFTNDVYSAYAQGMMTSFRPFRSDVGILHDPRMENNGNTGHLLGGEAAGGNGVQIGVDYSETFVESYTGKWRSFSDESDTHTFNTKYKFHKKEDILGNIATNTKDGSLYEPYYMRSTGELTASNGDDPNYMNDEFPESFSLNGTGQSPEIGGNYYDSYRENREKHSQSTLMRTFNDVKNTPAWTYDILQHHTETSYDSFASNRKDANVMDQIAEVTVFNTDGMRFEYGLPVFNHVKKDVLFSVADPRLMSSGAGEDGADGLHPNENLYDYTATTHVKKGNDQGVDEFFLRSTTPAYSYAHMLTASYSPDYVDIKGDGPTEDDLGYYVKYKYRKVADKYKWRAPFFDANYMEGALSNYADNRASYTYGEKEIYVVASIETKTHIAHFITSDRNDAYGVSSEHQENPLDGSETLNGQKKLDRIDLFSKREAGYNPNSITQTIPSVKSIHFKYSYDLCKNIDNYLSNDPDVSGNGKLTLEKVFFTYGNSRRSALSPYQFEYSDTNPDYQREGASNRWGYYQSQPFSNNHNFPYVNQQADYDTTRHKDASAWSITKVKMPSGAEISINYEQDDYGYVQNEKAMQSMKIMGIGSDNTGVNTSGDALLQDNLYLYYELNQNPELIDHPTLSAQALGTFMASNHVGGIDDFYFKAYMRLKPTPDGWEVGSEAHAYDYVEGYAKRDLSGVVNYVKQTIDGVERHMGCFKLKGVGISTFSDEHPFQKAAIQYIKLMRQDLIVAPEDSDEFFDPEEIFAIFDFFDDLMEFIQGYYYYARDNGYGNRISINYETNPSIIRLNSEDGIKYGGGHRVSKISLSDQWNVMTDDAEESFNYGQEYSYRLPDGSSSGVATYEPILGNEENPFRKPAYQNPGDFIVNNDAAYNDTPVGEEYFPSPNVGYSRIVVTNIVRDEEMSSNTRLTEKTGIGKSVYEFYTAKDFPVLFLGSEVSQKFKNNDSDIPFMGFVSVDNVAYGQAFAIHLNNMHGAAKAEIIYPETAVLFHKDQDDPTADYIEPAYSAKESYFYDTVAEYSSNSGNRLDNEVKIIFPDGTIKQTHLGRTIEFFTDSRESSSKSNTLGSQVDGGVTYGVTLLPILGIELIDETTEKDFRSIVTNKVVAKNGILTKVVSDKAGVQTIMEHLLFDSETGASVLSRIKNEFDKSIYNYDYPAHHQYEGMGGAYQNLNATYSTNDFDVLTTFEGVSNVLEFNYLKEEKGEVFFKGDELELLVNGTKYYSYWVIDTEELYTSGIGTEHTVRIASKVGDVTVLSGANLDMRVVRSGHRNHYTVSAGAKTYMEGKHVFTNLMNSLLPSSAIELTEEGWVYDFLRPVDCEGNPISGQVQMFIEDPHTFSFEYSDDSETYSKAYMEFPNTWNLFADSCKILSNYSFIKDEDIMHVQVSDSIDTIYTKAKWIDPEDSFPFCESILNVDAVKFHGDDWNIPYYELPNQQVAEYVLISDANANPYAYGKRGVWRAEKNYTYVTDRVQSDSIEGDFLTNIAQDGYFNEFTEFDWSASSQEDCNWRQVDELTMYSPYGFQLESKNALNQYSSALYAYDGALPVAIAQNTRYKELAYTGFEDIDDDAIHPYGSGGESVTDGHLELTSKYPINISSEEAHTGKYSLKYLPATPCETGEDNGANGVYFNFNPSNENTGFFDPEADKEYIVSVWVKQHEVNSNELELDEVVSLEVKKEMPTSVYNINVGWVNSYWTEGAMIEGWKKLEIKIKLLAEEDQNYLIRFSGKSCVGNPVYIDDIRIYPADGAMSSFVYDRDNLRLKAELDGNNYATFYDYDDAGALIQVKKETVDGVKTIKSSRSNVYKN